MSSCASARSWHGRRVPASWRTALCDELLVELERREPRASCPAHAGIGVYTGKAGQLERRSGSRQPDTGLGRSPCMRSRRTSRGATPQRQVPPVARPRNQHYLHEVVIAWRPLISPTSKRRQRRTVLCTCAALSIAARLSSLLRGKSCRKRKHARGLQQFGAACPGYCQAKNGFVSGTRPHRRMAANKRFAADGGDAS